MLLCLASTFVRIESLYICQKFNYFLLPLLMFGPFINNRPILPCICPEHGCLFTGLELQKWLKNLKLNSPSLSHLSSLQVLQRDNYFIQTMSIIMYFTSVLKYLWHSALHSNLNIKYLVMQSGNTDKTQFFTPNCNLITVTFSYTIFMF